MPFLLREPSEWDRPSLLFQLLTSPVKLLLRFVYNAFVFLRSPPKIGDPPIRVVCISDTHTQRKAIPDGDLLIHAGDLTNAGNIKELQDAIDWLASLPHRHKVAIAGNHDTYLDPRSRRTLPKQDQDGKLNWHNIRYLQHSSVTLAFPSHANRKLTLYGAPQIPACGGSEFAFQYPRGQDAWSETMPKNTNILITHTPPKFHHDLYGRHGCEWLLKEVWRVKPCIHIFGHIHAMPGQEVVCWDEGQRAFEKGEGRKSRGFLREVLDIRLWARVVDVVHWGVREFLWDRIWGGSQRRTLMVNAALMSQETGRVEHEVQVVEI